MLIIKIVCLFGVQGPSFDSTTCTPSISREMGLPHSKPKEIALERVFQLGISVQNKLKKTRGELSAKTDLEMGNTVRWLSERARDDSEASGHS